MMEIREGVFFWMDKISFPFLVDSRNAVSKIFLFVLVHLLGVFEKATLSVQDKRSLFYY